MNEIDELKARVDALQDACLKMFTLLAASMSGQPSSAAVLRTMFANVGAAQEQGQSDAFDDMATSTLRALASVALKQHPNDAEVLAVYRGLRPGSRH